jgi:hypothetical protein
MLHKYITQNNKSVIIKQIQVMHIIKIFNLIPDINPF